MSGEGNTPLQEEKGLRVLCIDPEWNVVSSLPYMGGCAPRQRLALFLPVRPSHPPCSPHSIQPNPQGQRPWPAVSRPGTGTEATVTSGRLVETQSRGRVATVQALQRV